MALALHEAPSDVAFHYRHFPTEHSRSLRKSRTRNVPLSSRPTSRQHAPANNSSNDMSSTPADDDSRSDRHRRVDPARRRIHRHGVVNDPDDDGVRLARSSVPLPSDGFRNRTRVPSLHREEAFRDYRTAKSFANCESSSNRTRAASEARSVDTSMSANVNAHATGDDAHQVAELYRLGLLYDDEHLRGSGFNLGAITHDEPSYSVKTKTRPGKVSKPGKPSRDGEGGWVTLPTDFDFASLQNDRDVAQFLAVPSREQEQPRSQQSTSRRGYKLVWRSAAPLDDGPATSISRTDGPAEKHEGEGRQSDQEGQDSTSDAEDRDWDVLSEVDEWPERTPLQEGATGAWVVLEDGG